MYVKPSDGSGVSASVTGTGSRDRWIRMDDSDVRHVSSAAVGRLLDGHAPTHSAVYLMFYRALST